MQLFTDLETHGATANAPETGAPVPLFACGCPLCTGAGGNSVLGAGRAGATPGQQTLSLNTGTVSDADAATLMSGSQWTTHDATGKTVITYSFATAASQFGGDSAQFSTTLQAFSAQDQATTRAMLAGIAAVCNVSFVEVPDNGPQAGQIRYAYSQTPNDMGYAGYAFFPSGSAVGGDVWIGKNQSAAQWDYYRPDLILHETLHAVGLKHPFDGSVTLATQDDIIANTVMSYSPVAGNSNGSLSQYPTEPMPLDVDALQDLYGAAAHNAGDTVYNLADPSFRNSFRALWDSGGNNTLDASAVGKGVYLDLHAGARSDIGAQVLAYSYAGGTWSTGAYTYTLALASATQIKNAVGSAFNDVLVGNALGNSLQGGAGDDRLVSGGGRDTIDGGTGNDTAVFSGLRSDYSVNATSSQIVVTRLSSPGDTATLLNVERIEFSNETLASFTAGGVPQSQDQVYVAEAFRLYKAAFDRLPDGDGLGYHSKSLESGLSLRDVAAQFMASPEFATLYGQAQDQAFVNLLYQNVLDRAPDAGGMAYYMAHLGSGAMTRADVLVGFSESPENQAALVGLGQVPLLYPV